uniref:Uncharacterized protein n=1 Tax=Ditylenchus dipsaci TaxID=166011 RepID=A0A915ESP4_9BILA
MAEEFTAHQTFILLSTMRMTTSFKESTTSSLSSAESTPTIFKLCTQAVKMGDYWLVPDGNYIRLRYLCFKQ